MQEPDTIGQKLWSRLFSESQENLKHNKMLGPLGQAWQNGSASAVYTLGRAIVNKLRLCGSL